MDNSKAIDYSLEIDFTTHQLGVIRNSNWSIVVARSLANNLYVTWQVFNPIESNTISWNDEYGIYSTSSGIKNGTVITKNPDVVSSAEIGKSYTLGSGAIISEANTDGQPGAYTLVDNCEHPNPITVGLFQDATVNGKSNKENIVSAVSVMDSFSVAMEPCPNLYLWLQQGSVPNSLVAIGNPITRLSFRDVNYLRVIYDLDNGKFVLAGNKKLAEGVIKYIEPAL